MRMRGKAAMKKLGAWLGDMLYPRASHCLCCQHPRLAEEDCLCSRCRERLKQKRVPPEACDRCLSPVKAGRPCVFCRSREMRHIARVYAPYRYGGEVRQLIHAFKFDACGEALPLLADAMLSALPRRDFDCLTPVPLHKRRLRQRGYNQALMLCQALSERTGIPTEELLERRRYRMPQSRLPLKRRSANVEGAFAARGEIEGKRVLLIDDVRTGGSTAAACAKTLVEAGAKQVSLCVCAVVYRRK